MLRFLAIVLSSVSIAACSVNNATEDASIKQYFDKYDVHGTFGMFNNASGEFTIYNLPRFRDTAYLPASTFKIINALVGIETGRVKDSAAIIPWDGVVRKVPEWNQDMAMSKAFENSAVPWFQELARRIGRDTMQFWLDTLGYGSLQKKPVIADNLDTFWLDNTIKVTADEQLGLVKRLYFGQLPFQPRSQRIVKSMMLRESNTSYSLSYKTGWGTSENNMQIGWLIGWLEKERHPFFFVLQVESANRDIDMPAVRRKLLMDILRHYGFLEEKRQ